jgi:regulator of replication initiation timing
MTDARELALENKVFRLELRVEKLQTQLAESQARVEELITENNLLKDENAELIYKLKKVADVDDCPDQWE